MGTMAVGQHEGAGRGLRRGLGLGLGSRFGLRLGAGPRGAWLWLVPCALALAAALGANHADAKASAKADVAAADVPAADAKAARAVIEAQLAALAADDAKRAFSYASPALRRHFGTAEHFIEMVRTSYPVVYRPTSVLFLKPQWVDGELLQGVHLSDDKGVLWLALYRLQRQKNKHWRISSCQIVPAEGRVT